MFPGMLSFIMLSLCLYACSIPLPRLTSTFVLLIQQHYLHIINPVKSSQIEMHAYIDYNFQGEPFTYTFKDTSHTSLNNITFLDS